MTNAAGCLILACGNTLRSDDGVGLHLADWAALHFNSDPRVRVICRQQWTPDLAGEIAKSEAILFLDCSLEADPGAVQLTRVPRAACANLAQHHLDAASLLALTQSLYGATPHRALQLTIGAGTIELGEQFSPEVRAALIAARRLLEKLVLEFLESDATAHTRPA